MFFFFVNVKKNYLQTQNYKVKSMYPETVFQIDTSHAITHIHVSSKINSHKNCLNTIKLNNGVNLLF